MATGLQILVTVIHSILAKTINISSISVGLLSEERDVGVIIDDVLNYSTNAKTVGLSSSAFQSLAIIKKTISSQHLDIFMKWRRIVLC